MKFVNIFHFWWHWTTKVETVCQGLHVFFACGLNTMCLMFIERKKYLKKSCMKNKNAHFIPCSIFLIYLAFSETFKQSELIYQIFYAVCTFSNLLVILCLIFSWISWQQHFALINFILSLLSNLTINSDTLFNSSHTFTCVCKCFIFSHLPKADCIIPLHIANIMLLGGSKIKKERIQDMYVCYMFWHFLRPSSGM